VTPLVIAHRGACWALPENTPEAFERAIEVGADYVEFDVHARADGALVVCHDRPMGGEPPLEAVLEVCAGRVGVMCELKTPWRYRRHDVVARVERLLPEDAVVVSFEARALKQVRRLRRLQHVGFGASVRGAASYAWAVGFADRRVRPRAIELARRLGLETTVYTVNDAGRMRELAALGASGIFTDRPDLARQVLGPPSG
jgi:glycerophosphoryl diester phosphodiesterase